MIKFTAVSVVLWLVDMFILKMYIRCSNGAAFRLAYNLSEGKEAIWFGITGWWKILNGILIGVSAIKLIFMYL